MTQKQLAEARPGPTTAQNRDGTVTVRIDPQVSPGLPVATICAAAINHLEAAGVQLVGDSNLGPGTWRLTPTEGNRLQPTSFQVRCQTAEQAQVVQAALHHKAIELGDLIVRLEVARHLNRGRRAV